MTNGKLYCSIACILTMTTAAQSQNFHSFTSEPSTVDLSEKAIVPVGQCENFAYRTDYDFTIFSAKLIETTETVPEHCQLDGIIRPEIVFRVNLPSEWNSRFYMHGNGGFAGEQPGEGSRTAAAEAALRKGFATAFTDTGHNSAVFPLATFANKSLAAEVDYTYRSIYLTAITGQSLVEEYYGKPDDYSYWDGCSTGGRQGLVFAQRFPEVFDGIVAGAPVLNFTDTMIEFVWNTLAIESAEPLTSGQLETMSTAVYDSCDGLDGAVDGLIRDPRQCSFDPATDYPRCEGGIGNDCLTDDQIDAVVRIYGGTQSKGATYFPGQPVGAEASDAAGASGWNNWLVSEGPSRQALYGQSFIENMAFIPDDPDRDWRAFDFDTDPEKIVTIRSLLDATNPDLSRFRESGGRMITYFGWADTALNPLMGIDYYDRVSETMGAPQDFYRFFTVPGMFHCRGGLGPEQIDVMAPLIDWVENGRAPETLVASTADDAAGSTQLLCPYPKTATLIDTAKPDQAGSWQCETP